MHKPIATTTVAIRPISFRREDTRTLRQDHGNHFSKRRKEAVEQALGHQRIDDVGFKLHMHRVRSTRHAHTSRGRGRDVLQVVGVMVVVEIRGRGAATAGAAGLRVVPNDTDGVRTGTQNATVHLSAGCLCVLTPGILARAVLPVLALPQVGLILVQRSKETKGAVEVVDGGALVQVPNKESCVALRPPDTDAAALDFYVLHALLRDRCFLPRAHLHKAVAQIAHRQLVPLDVHHFDLAHAGKGLRQARLVEAASQVANEKDAVLFRLLLLPLLFLVLRQAAVVLSFVRLLVLLLVLVLLLLVLVLVMLLLVLLLWLLLVLLMLLLLLVRGLLVGMLAVVLLCGV